MTIDNMIKILTTAKEVVDGDTEVQFWNDASQPNMVISEHYNTDTELAILISHNGNDIHGNRKTIMVFEVDRLPEA